MMKALPTLKNLTIGLLILASGQLFIRCSRDSIVDPGPTLSQELQEVLDNTLEIHNGIGVSAAVLMPGQEIWVGASGISHDTVPIETDMIFCLGSITKNYMAALVLQLVEEGVLTLEDPLNQWLPSFPNIDSAITIRQLLNHTSGIYDFTRNPAWGESILADLNRTWSPEETIHTFVLEPVFAAGTNYEYSNTNYLLVGMIIKEATHSQISTLLRERILTPLGLAHTFFSIEEDIIGTVAHRWEDMNGDGQPDDISSYPRNAHDSMLWTTGALYSTAEDVVRYSHALFNCELFTRESLEQMLDYVPYPYNPALGYGFGILIIPDFIPNIQALGHDGTVYGFKARWVYLPDYDVHIAVLLNEDNYDCLTAITAGLARVVLNHR